MLFACLPCLANSEALPRPRFGHPPLSCQQRPCRSLGSPVWRPEPRQIVAVGVFLTHLLPGRLRTIGCEKDRLGGRPTCGAEVVTGDEDSIVAAIRRMASRCAVEADLAHDGMTLVLR